MKYSKFKSGITASLYYSLRINELSLREETDFSFGKASFRLLMASCTGEITFKRWSRSAIY